MQVEKKCHILLAIVGLLVTSGQCADGRDPRSGDRGTLLDLILQVMGDSQQRDKHVSRRYSSGLFTAPQDLKLSSSSSSSSSFSSSSSSSSSREKPFYVSRLDNSRPVEIAPRELNLKDKFIQHFTGPVKFSSECRTHFHRIYHNTRDCSRPACMYTFLLSC
ncbi:Protein ALKAL-like [Merluccius polli]|uniref:Protein ALKAL-like n=1 Tax=Merluccius polli TaxID=89951 RepID=A0AA47NA26_MERPO|nr:Protein ALKAL-like [Merluccius polli]